MWMLGSLLWATLLARMCQVRKILAHAGFSVQKKRPTSVAADLASTAPI